MKQADENFLKVRKQITTGTFEQLYRSGTRVTLRIGHNNCIGYQFEVIDQRDRCIYSKTDEILVVYILSDIEQNYRDYKLIEYIIVKGV